MRVHATRQQPDRALAEFRHPSRMRDDRRAARSRSGSQSVARGQAAVGALRSCRRRQGADQGQAATRAPDLWRYRELLPVRDPANIVSLGETITPLIRMPKLLGQTRRRRNPGQGRRPPADRLVQGARPGHGGVDGQSARHQAHGDADQWQCRRRACGLCRACRHQDHDLLPGGHAGSERQRDRAAGRHRLSRQRPDRRLRQDRRRGQGQGRLVRHLDAEGAVPDRGQEDDGPRARRAARIGTCRT